MSARKPRISDRFITSSMDQVWIAVAGLRAENHNGEQVAPELFEDHGIVVGTDDGCLFADYYGGDGRPPEWIDPRLVKAAEAEGCFWEWRDAGAIILVEP